MARVCAVPGCGKAYYSRGYCCAHSSKLRKYGDPLGKRHSSPGEGQAYFENVVLPYQGNECLVWPFGRGADGCGIIRLNGKKINRVPRLVCEAENGPEPSPGMDAAHSCGNGHLGCVTRKHLRWATRYENVHDAIGHGTHAKGSKNGHAKLNESLVRQIRDAGRFASCRKIAEQYGVSAKSIHSVLAMETWKHV